MLERESETDVPDATILELFTPVIQPVVDRFPCGCTLCTGKNHHCDTHQEHHRFDQFGYPTDRIAKPPDRTMLILSVLLFFIKLLLFRVVGGVLRVVVVMVVGLV